MMPRMLRVISLAIFAAISSACSWFGDENEPIEIKPNPLPTIKSELSLNTVWSKKLEMESVKRLSELNQRFRENAL